MGVERKRSMPTKGQGVGRPSTGRPKKFAVVWTYNRVDTQPEKIFISPRWQLLRGLDGVFPSGTKITRHDRPFAKLDYQEASAEALPRCLKWSLRAKDGNLRLEGGPGQRPLLSTGFTSENLTSGVRSLHYERQDEGKRGRSVQNEIQRMAGDKRGDVSSTTARLGRKPAPPSKIDKAAIRKRTCRKPARRIPPR